MDETLKKHAIEIFLAGVRAADPREAVLRHLRVDGNTMFVGGHPVPMDPAGRILVVGAGKAAARMASAVEEVLGERLSGGLVAVKDGYAVPTRRIEVVEAAHPVPDDRGLAAAGRIARVLEGADATDLVLCLWSGGASALLPSPTPPVTLADERAVTDLLLSSGADIRQINAVRKHLSALKGGNAAALAHPARVVSLILSDVIGDSLDVIASGPSVPDRTTFSDAMTVLERFQLTEKVPRSVLHRLKQGVEGKAPETPKAGDIKVEGAINVLVGSNVMALIAARDAARRLGYNAFFLPEPVVGEARTAGERLALLARQITGRTVPIPLPVCVLGGGETTVTMRQAGKGGRNQELALAAAPGIEGLERTLLLSGGTDGTDGPTPAAGAVVDGTTCARARSLGFDPAAHLAAHNAYPLFEALGDLLTTGPTGTNVNDLQILLIGENAGLGGGR